MRFTLSAEQRQFAASLDDLLSAADLPTVIRAWSDGTYEPGLKVWQRLADLGLPALIVPESHGGIGASAVDLAVACETLGYHAMPGPVVDSVAVLPVLLPGTPLAEHLPGLAAGELIGTIALPPHVPYLLDADVADVRLCVVDGVLHEAQPGSPVDSVDRARRLSNVDVGAAVSDVDVRPAEQYGVLAVSAQLLGAGRRLLDMSVAYAKQREQYGRPIGQYQAVKHLLADVVTRLELARPLVHGAAVTGSGRDVSAARVACADAAYLAARTALQVHGAIGYTAEHDLGLWFTKIRGLQSAWGTQAYHRAQVLEALRC